MNWGLYFTIIAQVLGAAAVFFLLAAVAKVIWDEIHKP